MDIPTPSELLARIEDFCRRHDIADTRFGRDAVNNPAFVGSLRREPPVSPTQDTLLKLQEFMRRKDAEAATLAKLHAPIETVEEERPLPFSSAPVSPTGDALPTSSPTTAPRPTPRANGSCPGSSTHRLNGVERPSRSSSTEPFGQSGTLAEEGEA